MSVRVRIAPAPSGSLHIGNARTALYNWLFARHHGGAFVLRIEDTDQQRASEEHLRSVIEEMHWLGLDYDEGPDIGGPYAPYVQSERLAVYKGEADRLYEQGLAYRCYCTPEELKQRRERARAEHRKPGYDGRCYRLTDAERAKFEDEERRWVLRFHVDDEGEITFEDLITGPITWRHADIEDFTVMRQNGFPFYVLGAAVDDDAMGITHVIRGMDLQSATPKQILVLQALGRALPKYAHVPLVMGPGGQKLSKRYGGGSVEWYRDHGFLPDAVINSLVLLGTGFGDETIISREEMIESFSLKKVHASSAIFDLGKLDWMNGEYIRTLSDPNLAEMLLLWLHKAELIGDPPTEEERRKVDLAVPAIKTRMKRLEEAPNLIRSWFAEPEVDRDDFEKVMREPFIPILLDAARDSLSALQNWDLASVEKALRAAVETAGAKPKNAFRALYVAVTGSATSAPLFDTVAVIGKEKTLERLAWAKAMMR